MLAALSSCGMVEKDSSSAIDESNVLVVESDSVYTDSIGTEVGVMLPKWPTYDPDADKWEGPGAGRINQVWCGNIYLDTIEGKWKWSISDMEKVKKLTREQIMTGDSLILMFNNL